jgi:hypothetical protein
MLTPQFYGNSARYVSGNYFTTFVPPARFLAGLTTTYGATISNLPMRKTNYYSGANQIPTNRLLTAGVVFVGILGPRLLAFPTNSDWSTFATLS